MTRGGATRGWQRRVAIKRVPRTDWLRYASDAIESVSALA